MNRSVSSPLIATGVVFSLLLGGFALSPGQAAPRSSEAEKKNTEHYIELVRRDLRQEKRQIIGEALALKQSEADAFWPVYERYEAELNGRGQKPRQSFICNRYRCSGRVADWLGSLGYSSFLKDS